MKSLLPPAGCLIQDNNKINVALLVFFVIVGIIFAYSIIFLLDIGKILIKNSELSDTEFITKYNISRSTLEKYQTVFITMLVISGSIVLSIIWTSLPKSVHCWLFNRYTILLFVILVFTISIKVIFEISPKHFASEYLRVINIIVLSMTGIALLVYLWVIVLWLSGKKGQTSAWSSRSSRSSEWSLD